MERLRHSSVFFAVAGVSLLILIVSWAFIDQALEDADTPTTITNGTTLNSVDVLKEDPLVTVVPKDVLIGTPQPLSTDPQRGAKNPQVTIVEFGDFECESCAKMSLIMDRLVTQYPNELLHVWKDFPIPQKHYFSETAAQAARCAQDQGAFWEYHDALFAQQKSFVLAPWGAIAEELSLDTGAFAECLQSQSKKSLVVAGYFIARTFDLNETPAYYINEKLVTGEKSEEEMRSLIEEALKE